MIAAHRYPIAGAPVQDLICTSYIERSNLTVRTHCKRLARLTLAFSKKLENFKAAIALHLVYYNFVKTHGTIRCTPAQEAGIESAAWKVSDSVDAA
ncbi:MAG: transposase [Chthoniobacter sp.]|nr:transposase [Chthoniobacter sp.]